MRAGNSTKVRALSELSFLELFLKHSKLIAQEQERAVLQELREALESLEGIQNPAQLRLALDYVEMHLPQWEHMINAYLMARKGGKAMLDQREKRKAS
jgi:hypothetical protein